MVFDIVLYPMNWLSESNKGVTSVDWFAMSCKLGFDYTDQQPKCPDGFQVVPMGSTAVWDKRWYLCSTDGEKVATILCSPKSRLIKANRAVVEIANKWLYMDTFPDIVDVVLSVFPMQPDGMNRIDLCHDFEMTDARYQILGWLEDGQASVKGVRQGVVWRAKHASTWIPHQLSWGGKESRIKWKVYWKYNELHQDGTQMPTKPYIEELWKLAGMAPKMVWRLEVSISNSNAFDSLGTGKPITYMQWWSECARIFSSLYADKFIVRMEDGHANKRLCPRLKFLDLYETRMLCGHKAQDKDYVSNVNQRLVTRAWKDFTDWEVQASPFAREAVRSYLMELCQLPECVDVICRRFGLEANEVIRAISQSSYVS